MLLFMKYMLKSTLVTAKDHTGDLSRDWEALGDTLREEIIFRRAVFWYESQINGI